MFPLLSTVPRISHAKGMKMMKSRQIRRGKKEKTSHMMPQAGRSNGIKACSITSCARVLQHLLQCCCPALHSYQRHCNTGNTHRPALLYMPNKFMCWVGRMRMRMRHISPRCARRRQQVPRREESGVVHARASNNIQLPAELNVNVAPPPTRQTCNHETAGLVGGMCHASPVDCLHAVLVHRVGACEALDSRRPTPLAKAELNQHAVKHNALSKQPPERTATHCQLKPHQLSLTYCSQPHCRLSSWHGNPPAAFVLVPPRSLVLSFHAQPAYSGASLSPTDGVTGVAGAAGGECY